MIRTIVLLTTVTAASLAAIVPSASSKRDNTHATTSVDVPVNDVSAIGATIVPQQQVAQLTVSDQFHGVTRPVRQADLPSLVRGMINRVHVNEGQAVRQGDPLLTLDNRVPQARLDAATVQANLTGALRRAEVHLRMTQRRCERLRRAVHRGAAGEFELEEAEAECEQAEAAVQQQRDVLQAAEAERQLAAAQLDQYTIAAPFDGVITEIHQMSGAADLSMPLVSIADVTSLEVEMHLPTELYGKIQRGQQISLRAGSPVSGILPAEVVSVSPVINSASDTFRCLLRLTNQGRAYPAGFMVSLSADPPSDAVTAGR